MAALWGRAIEVTELRHHSQPDLAGGGGQLLALEAGPLLLSTLDLGAGEIGWRFASDLTGGRFPGARRPLLMLRLIRGGTLRLAEDGCGDGSDRLERADGGTVHVVPAGQIVLIPVSAPVEVILPQGGRLDLGILSQAPETMSGSALLDGTLASGHHLAFVAGYMLRAAPHPSGRTLELRNMFLQALDHVATDLAMRRADQGETFFERFKFLVAANLGRADLSIEDIARALEVSPRQLQRRLKVLGTSFRSHLQKSRLVMAREMILTNDGQFRVADLAYRCGFSDPNYFSRAYAKLWRVPPTSSRQKSISADQPHDPCNKDHPPVE